MSWLYSDELAERICEQLADGQSLRAICAADGMPDRTTVMRWQASNPDFATKCARAREAQADHLFEGMAEIEDGVLSGAVDAQAARVVLSSQQWRASKLRPKVYGDKTTLAGDADNPVAITGVTWTIVKPEDPRG